MRFFGQRFLSPRFMAWRRACLLLLCVMAPALACQQSAPDAQPPWNASQGTPLPTSAPTEKIFFAPARREAFDTLATPTPDPPHRLPGLRTEPEEYTIQAGDTLGEIAHRYGVSLETLIQANDLPNPNLLEVGQVIKVPPPSPDSQGSAYKIIPDSELVYGPGAVTFNIAEFVQKQNGYLARYQQQVEDLGNAALNGAQIVARVAQQYSVNPRLLLAVLEYTSGWVRQAQPPAETMEFPLGVRDQTRRAGLYRQLAYAANQLNRGFYLWRVDGVSSWVLSDGSVTPIAPTINAGTAGVQQFFAVLYGRADWDVAVSSKGLFTTYFELFGYPFDYALEPLIPPGIRQPTLQLPFENGVAWSFTGGPHGGWGDGSAWAALDFAPPITGLGCGDSDLWVVAMANGPIVRSETGEVVQDVDTSGIAGGSPGDGFEQTGWTILYMHIAAAGRAQAGAYLRAGERIGHPSCEGGFSTATHTHLARRYNGEWIPADQKLPFVMDGWISRGTGIEYDGFLEKDDLQLEALDAVAPENHIYR